MKRTKVNPWTNPIFHDAGILIENPHRILFLNGQAAVSADGESLHPGDIRGQAEVTLDNIEKTLKEADMSLANIVRMNTYVTDVDDYVRNANPLVSERLARFDVRPPGVLAGVSQLARPEILIELEAIAVD